jgi:hypothetical protein
MGWIGSKQVNLGDVRVAVITPNATVAVQSLDQNAISESRNILISLGARSVPESKNRMPFRSEPVLGHLAIHASGGMKLYKQVSSASARQEIPVSYQNGQYQITLTHDIGTYWLMLN